MSSTCFIPEGSFNGYINNVTRSIPCNDNVGSVNLLTQQVEYTQYGYNQLEWAVYLFTAVNAFAVAAHVVQGIYWRSYWTIPTIAAGALVEVIGWAGRIWSLKSTVWDTNFGGQWYSNYNGFLMQIVCLVIAPTFFSAAMYVLLNRLIRATGGRYSSVTPDSFTSAFIVADILCIIVQGVGGGIAGSANSLAGANNGAYIMTAGVCLQLVITVLFVGLYAEFMYRYLRRVPAKKQYDITAWLKCGAPRRRSREKKELFAATASAQGIAETSVGSVDKEWGYGIEANGLSRGRVTFMLVVLGFTTLLICVRGVYRSVELTDGWRGPIAINQPLFLGMDALLMAIFPLAYVVYHPGLALGRN